MVVASGCSPHQSCEASPALKSKIEILDQLATEVSELSDVGHPQLPARFSRRISTGR